MGGCYLFKYYLKLLVKMLVKASNDANWTLFFDGALTWFQSRKESFPCIILIFKTQAFRTWKTSCVEYSLESNWGCQWRVGLHFFVVLMPPCPLYSRIIWMSPKYLYDWFWRVEHVKSVWRLEFSPIFHFTKPNSVQHGKSESKVILPSVVQEFPVVLRPVHEL